MNQLFFRFFALAVFVSVTTFTTFSQTSEKTDLPTAKESLKTLFKNGNVQLASISSCKSEKTEPTDKTIFDYLSAIIANQAEPKTKTSLEYNAKLVTGKNNSRLWQIELTFNNTDEESGDPWNVGFKFLMQTKNHQIVRGSLECIGN